MKLTRHGVRLTSLSLLNLAVLAGCSGSDTASDSKVRNDSVATDSVSTEASTTDVPDTAASPTEARTTETSATPTPASDSSTSEAAGTDAEVVVARLAEDDPTCEALERVRKINDQSGALSNEFIAKALGASVVGTRRRSRSSSKSS